MRAGYLRYHLGEDGLISGSTDYSAADAGFPSFPLEKLTGFLVNYIQTDAPGRVTKSPAAGPGEWIPAVVIFLFCIVDMLRPGVRYKKRSPYFGDKRIAA